MPNFVNNSELNCLMKSKQWQKAEGFEWKHSSLPIPTKK